MSEPCRYSCLDLRLEFRVVQTSLHVSPSLLDERMKSAELVQRFAEHDLAPVRGRRRIEIAVLAYKQFRIAMQGRLCSRQVSIAELFCLLFNFTGRLGVHVADADSRQIQRQPFEQIQTVELGLDLLGK